MLLRDDGRGHGAHDAAHSRLLMMGKDGVDLTARKLAGEGQVMLPDFLQRSPVAVGLVAEARTIMCEVARGDQGRPNIQLAAEHILKSKQAVIG